MAAAVKWKIQRSKGFLISAVCLLLIAASQIMEPLDRYIHHAEAQFSLDQDQAADADRGSKKKHFSYTGAPFIRQQQYSNTKFAVLQQQPQAQRQQFLSRNLRWHHQIRAADFAAQGIAGPFALLGDHEMQLLPKIVTAWEDMKIHLRSESLRSGFEPPSNKTCFLWLQDCVDLAKHKAIVKAAESFLTQPVLLFGMSVWEAPPKSQQTLQLNLEGYQCPTVDVLVNSGLHLFQNSHKMTRKMIFKLANQLKAVHRFYDGSPLLHQRLESTTLQHLNDKLEGGVDVRDLDSAPGEAFVINGRSLYTTSNPTDAARMSMLLKYVPVNCTLRDQVLDGTQLGYFTRSVVPPTLLTSIIPFPTRNDIRDGLLRKESLYFTNMSEHNGDERLLGTLPNSSITLFRKQAQGSTNDLHPGYARSSLLARITVEKLVTQELGVTFNSFVENRILVLVRGCLIHHRAAGNEHREVRELKPGSLAFLSNTEVHALAAAPSAEFISIRWTGQERYSNPLSSFITRRSINDGKQIFEMPVSDLGAINAKTTVLRSGQAYDPENEADCDVVVLVVKGGHLQVIPAQEFLQSNEAVLIPAGEGCIVWNSGALPVTIVVLQLLKKTDDRDSSLLEAAYRTRGKIM